jgi:hypothetical protein
VFYLALVLATAALNGCGSGSGSDERAVPLPIFVSEITSDIEADGDIGLTLDGIYSISSALDTGNVLAGIDPVTGEEFRGFLDFPLRGSDGVPLDAVIESATLEIFINGVSISAPDGILPFIIDLVDFQPPFLITDDFNRVVQPPLLTRPVDFFPSDVGSFVVIDVTALMDEAQIERLPDFQLRFLLDFSAASGLIEIDDSDLEIAPLLTVSYF